MSTETADNEKRKRYIFLTKRASPETILVTKIVSILKAVVKISL